MRNLLLIIIAALVTHIGFSDDMPLDVKRLKEQRDRKVSETIKKIDAVYYRELIKLKKKYAAQRNYTAAAYVEKMQIAIVDSHKTTPDKPENESVNGLTTIVLLARDADLHGVRIAFDKRTGSIGCWNLDDETIAFEIPNLEKAKYEISIKHGTTPGDGGKLRIKLNNKTYREEFDSTGGWKSPKEKSIGYFEHDGGKVEIELSIMEMLKENKPVMNFYSLTLSPQ